MATQHRTPAPCAGASRRQQTQDHTYYNLFGHTNDEVVPCTHKHVYIFDYDTKVAAYICFILSNHTKYNTIQDGALFRLGTVAVRMALLLSVPATQLSPFI